MEELMQLACKVQYLHWVLILGTLVPVMPPAGLTMPSINFPMLLWHPWLLCRTVCIDDSVLLCLRIELGLLVSCSCTHLRPDRTSQPCHMLTCC
jgi:hypothetical protein